MLVVWMSLQLILDALESLMEGGMRGDKKLVDTAFKEWLEADGVRAD